MAFLFKNNFNYVSISGGGGGIHTCAWKPEASALLRAGVTGHYEPPERSSFFLTEWSLSIQLYWLASVPPDLPGCTVPELQVCLLCPDSDMSSNSHRSSGIQTQAIYVCTASTLYTRLSPSSEG